MLSCLPIARQAGICDAQELEEAMAQCVVKASNHPPAERRTEVGTVGNLGHLALGLAVASHRSTSARLLGR